MKGYSLTGNILGGAGPTPSYIWNIPTYVIIKLYIYMDIYIYMGYIWMNYKPPTKWDAHPSKYGKPMLNILYGKLWHIHTYIYIYMCV